MPPKRPAAKDKPSRDNWQITDEWGIYDPAKAGMQALYARLGRPILTASPSNSRRERRRAARPQRTSEGVGLAIDEARRRAGLEIDRPSDVISQSPARALRAALKARQASEVAVETPIPPAPVLMDAPAPPAAVAAAPRRRSPRKAVAPSAPETGSPAVDDLPASRAKTRPPTRGRRTKAAAPATDAAPTPPGPAPRPAHPPAPSPRRPRGPVPLAAWAHAVNDAPAPAPRQTDRRGFWRGVFRIPAEVALVEYAHGCRIQRLLIEAATESVPEFI